MDLNQARIQWEKAAPGWAKWEDVVSNAAFEATQQMLDMAGVSVGSKVLDLASGAGSQTLIAAKRVGPKGEVVANDISETMLDHVKKNAKNAGLDNVSTLLGAVQELDISPNSFDAVICRFALMLFSNPEIVLKKIYDLLKPSGKIGVVVFSTPVGNEFLVKPMQILLKHAGKQPPVGAPGLFSMGAPGMIENLLEKQGYKNIKVQKQTMTIRMPKAEETLQMIQEAFGAYRAVIADSPEDVQKSAWAEILDFLNTLDHGKGIAANSEILIACGKKV